MSKTKGIKFERDAKGRAVKAIVDLKKNPEFEDFFDAVIADERKQDEKIPFEQTVKALEKKHGFKIK